MVSIRPLQLTDICDRTIVGRQQITADGNHPIDGVAFGRRSPSAGAQPSIEVPIRKRRRIDNGNNDDSDAGSDTPQIGLRPSFDDRDNALVEGDGENYYERSIDEDEGRCILPESEEIERDDSDASGPSDEGYDAAVEVTSESDETMEYGSMGPTRSSDEESNATKKQGANHTSICDIFGGVSELDYSTDKDSDAAVEATTESDENMEDDSEDPYRSSDQESDATNEPDADQNTIRDLFFREFEPDYSSDIDFDPAAEATNESDENMEDDSNDPNRSSDEESDTTSEPDANHMSIRDLFFTELEPDYFSDEDFDAATEVTNDYDENMSEDSDRSNYEDSDYTDNPDAFALPLLDLVQGENMDDRSSDEEFEPTYKCITDHTDGSDKENSPSKVRL